MICSTALDLRDVVLVGASLGGWIAAEIAVKTTERISRLVLIDSVGIKVGDREARDIADIYAITDRQLAEIAYADPQKMARDTKSLPEDELILMARSREATGRYAWSPYMHNPKLKSQPAPDSHSGAGAVGRGRSHRDAGIWPRLCGGPSGRALCSDRKRRAFPAS